MSQDLANGQLVSLYKNGIPVYQGVFENMKTPVQIKECGGGGLAHLSNMELVNGQPKSLYKNLCN